MILGRNEVPSWKQIRAAGACAAGSRAGVSGRRAGGATAQPGDRPRNRRGDGWFLMGPARSALAAHPADDPLGRLARAEATLDPVAQPGIAHQLALPCPPSIREALRHDAPGAAGLRDLAVVEMIAPQLAEDRRAVPAKPARHLVRARLRLPPAFDLAALRKETVREPNLCSVILSWLNPSSSTESRISG